MGEYKNSNTLIDCECEFGHRFKSRPSDLIRGNGCPYCSGHKAMKGFNTIGDKRPDLIQYFKNKEEAFNYCPSSEQYIDAICPICGYSEKRKVKEITRAGGVACKVCSNNKIVSIPNRFIRNIILLRKDILDEFEFEYKPQWIPKGNKYRYDSYFKYQGKTYICEVDGLQHKTGIFQGKEIDVKEKDKIKEKLAKENNIDYFIRIKAYRNDLKYLKEEFNKSILKEIFNITDEEFEKIWIKCQGNLFKEIIDEYNRDSNQTLTKIGEKFGVSISAVSSCLIKANELGVCNYNFVPFNSKQVKLVDLKTGEIKYFRSCRKCAEYLGENEATIRYHIKRDKRWQKYSVDYVENI